MRKLSGRTATFTDSVIRRMTRVSNQYGAVNLSQGFPDFDPPKELTDALAKAAHDGPLREPYTCYLQGGLNFAASRAGVLLAVQNAYFKD